MFFKSKRNTKIFFVVLFICVLIGATFTSIYSIKVGSKVGNVKIRDSDDEPSWIPSLGSKVLTLFYTDPDVPDQNDPFADKLKAAGVEFHWFGYYHKWIPQENFYYAAENYGFKTNPEGHSEQGSYTPR